MLRRLLIAGFAGTAMACALVGAPVAAQAAEPQWYANHNLIGTAHQQAIAWNEIELESGQEAYGKIHCTNVMNFTVWNEGGHGVGAFEGWGTNACKAPELEEFLEKFYAQPIAEGLIKTPLTVFATSELPMRPEAREGETCAEPKKTKLEECKNESERSSTVPLFTTVRRRASSFPWKVKLVHAERQEEEVVVAKIGVPPEGQSCYPLESGKAAGWEKVPTGCVKVVVVCPQIPAEVVFYGAYEPVLENGVKNGLFFSKFEFGSEAGELVSEAGEAPETHVSGSLKIASEQGLELLTAK